MSVLYANFPAGKSRPSPTVDGKYTIHATAPTDIWRKPPNLDVLDAPIIYSPMPVSRFEKARVTASGDWKTLYDQGGLVLILPSKSSSTQKRWVKAGIEFYNNKPCMSVVAADEWADWSLLPLTGSDASKGKMTVEIEREQEPNGDWGTVLRVLQILDGGEKTPIREVTWAFHDVDEQEEMWVGMFAAKPTKDIRESLTVHLQDFEVELRD